MSKIAKSSSNLIKEKAFTTEKGCGETYPRVQK